MNRPRFASSATGRSRASGSTAPRCATPSTASLIGELADYLRRRSRGDAGVRAIVLGGSGKAFCAGADLAFMREAAAYTWEQNHADAGAPGRDAVVDVQLSGAGDRAHPRRLLRRRPRPRVGVRHPRRRRGRHLLAQRGAARPAAGDDQPVRRARDGRAGGAPLLRHRRALRRRRGARRAASRTRSARPPRSTTSSAGSPPRSSPTGRWRRAHASVSCETSPAARSAPSCAPRRRAASPTSAPAPKAGKASRASSTSAARRGDRQEAMNLDLTQLVAIAAALGWASGLRLYAVVFITGLAGWLGWVDLPGDLHVLAQADRHRRQPA